MKRLTAILILAMMAYGSFAGTDNIAPKSKVTASTFLDDRCKPENVTDGLIGIPGIGEWACEGVTTDWGYIRFPWIRLDWEQPQTIDRIVLFDRPSMKEFTASCKIIFSDIVAVFAPKYPMKLPLVFIWTMPLTDPSLIM